MTSLEDIKEELKRNVRFQETPIAFDDVDYRDLVYDAAKRLYVDEGLDSFLTDYSEQIISTITQGFLSRDLNLIELEYLEVSAEINFYNLIKNSWSTLVSFTTDAMSVTGTGNVFKSINGNVLALEDRLAILSFKFTHKNPTVYTIPNNYPGGTP